VPTQETNLISNTPIGCLLALMEFFADVIKQLHQNPSMAVSSVLQRIYFNDKYIQKGLNHSNKLTMQLIQNGSNHRKKRVSDNSSLQSLKDIHRHSLIFRLDDMSRAPKSNPLTQSVFIKNTEVSLSSDSISSGSDSESSNDASDTGFDSDQPLNVPGSARKVHPLRTNKNGLPKNIQKQLLFDIQAAGGIQNCNLKSICQKRPSTYGGENRRKIQNKVNGWKSRLSAAEFNAICKQAGVPIPSKGKQKADQENNLNTPVSLPPQKAKTCFVSSFRTPVMKKMSNNLVSTLVRQTTNNISDGINTGKIIAATFS